MTRVGVFGGTFDPVHYGHLILAEQCREQCELHEVLFVPAGLSPSKLGVESTSGNHRAEMLELAIAGQPAFKVDRRELKRPGPSFTVETLEELQNEDPSRELFLLLGADALFDFPTWRSPQRIAELAHIVVVNRRGEPVPDMNVIRPQLGDAVVSRIQLVKMPGSDISATQIRRRVREGRTIRYLTPRAVECYIDEHNLFRREPRC